MAFTVNTAPPRYKITAMVSVYTAERFLRGCLEDLVAQTLFDQTEVLIIDAHSPENEQAIAQEFVEKYHNITYFRTDERETLYASWNRALSMAQGQYITNANADDRHAPTAFETLSAALDARPEVALVYADCRVTYQENGLFHTAPVVGSMRWLPYDHVNILRRCEMGPQPMWRRCVHEKVGLFDAQYTVTGDYDMWLRMSEHYPFLHLPQELGLYLTYDNNLETQNPERTQQEYLQVQRQALQRFMTDDFVPHSPLDVQLAKHTQILQRYLCNIKSGHSIRNQNKLAYHVFAYLLLNAKLNKMPMDEMYRHVSQLPKSVPVEFLQSLVG